METCPSAYWMTYSTDVANDTRAVQTDMDSAELEFLQCRLAASGTGGGRKGCGAGPVRPALEFEGWA